MTAAERKSDCKLTRDTPYIAPTGELLGVYCEELEEKLPRYDGTALYCKQDGTHLVGTTCLLKLKIYRRAIGTLT